MAHPMVDPRPNPTTPRDSYGVSAEEAAASVTAHLDAGADHVVVQVAVDAPTNDPLPNLRAVAAALCL